jgi:hypothetical protein
MGGITAMMTAPLHPFAAPHWNCSAKNDAADCRFSVYYEGRSPGGSAAISSVILPNSWDWWMCTD